MRMQETKRWFLKSKKIQIKRIEEILNVDSYLYLRIKSYKRVYFPLKMVLKKIQNKRQKNNRKKKK